MENTVSTKNKATFLEKIERFGNRMPHPFILFLWLLAIVVVLSAICSAAGVSAVHPGIGETLSVKNFLSFEGIQYFLLNFASNYQGMFILASVLLLSVFSGICEHTGFFSAAIRAGLKNAKGVGIVAVVSFIGVLSNAAGDAAWILIPPIAAMIFYGAGRNPIAGLFCGYAAVGGGFSTEFIPGYDMLIVPVTNQAAQMIDPDFQISYLTGFFCLFVSGILITVLNTIVTIKIIEPRLGKYSKTPDSSVGEYNGALSEQERIALKKAVMALVIFLAVLVVVCIPKNSFMRSDTGSLIFASPLMDGLLTILLAFFGIPGIVYGVSIGKIKNANDLIGIMIKAAEGIAPFLVMLIAIAQFINVFTASNMGAILSIKGADILKSLNLPPQVIIVLFIVFVAFINLFIGSGSTKWMLLGPIFVPMLMQLNFHPAFIQVAYRMGDCATNHLTPLMAYMIILLTYCKKYDSDVGMGTIISNMFAYSVVFLIAQCIFIVIWMTLGIPVGFNGPIFLN